MTKLEFLQDTVKYYSENTNRRCVNNVIVGCYYSPENAGKIGISDGCAIGRHLKDSLKEKLDDTEESEVNTTVIFNKLPKKLKELGKDFLTDIQNLHDLQKYWNSEGLSKVGEEYYKDIKEKYEL